MKIRLNTKIAQQNYNNLYSKLEISETGSATLIKLTHGFLGFLRDYPIILEDLIEDCETKGYKGATALNHIKSNYKNRAIESKLKSESKIIGPSS